MSYAKSIIQKYLSGLAEGEAPDADALDKLIDAEEPKLVVPKETYLSAQATIKANKESIATLEKQVEEGSEAAKTIEQLQADIAARDKKEAKAAADAKFTAAATKLGATNTRLVKLALIEDGIDLETIDDEMLELKIEKISQDEDFKQLFKAPEDDDADDKEDDKDSKTNSAAGYKVIDNGIKGKGKASDEDAIAAKIAAAFGNE